MNADTLNYILTACIAVIGFFLKDLFYDLKLTKDEVQKNITDIEVLKSNNKEILNMLSEVKADVKDLVKEIHNRK